MGKDILSNEGVDPTDSSTNAGPVILPQILKSSTGLLMRQMGIEDYIETNNVIGDILAMVAVSPQVRDILGEIVDETGAHFCTRTLSEIPEATNLIAEGEACFSQITPAVCAL